MKKSTAGFTVIELITAIVLLSIISLIFFSQKATLESVNRDKQRKTAINAMHYNLEEVVKPSLSGYPSKLTASQLKAMDPALMKDPFGIEIGDKMSNYRYSPTGCNGGAICSGYTLTADLERESDFIKTNN